MYTLIAYRAGIMVEVVVLKAMEDRMRVAAAGFPDAVEFRRVDAQWTAESGEVVEFEFMLAEAAEPSTIAKPAPGVAAGAA